MNQFNFTSANAQIAGQKGVANGLASLDSNGLVPNSQLPGATQSAAGTMSAADKTKLDGIATGATANVVSDSLSDTSTTNALSAAKGKALNDSITALNTQISTLNSIEDKQITRIGTHFTERSAFKARRVGNTITIFSYVNISTQVPATTEFANIGFPTAEGVFLFIQGDGTQGHIVTCSSGKLKPDGVLPTGYYYVVGNALVVV